MTLFAIVYYVWPSFDVDLNGYLFYSYSIFILSFTKTAKKYLNTKIK